MSDEPTPPSGDTLALETGILLTRAHVAADVRALKDQLSPERLKDRAVEAAERSVHNIALHAKRRLAALPRALLRSGREHPLAATLLGVGLSLILWKATRRR